MSDITLTSSGTLDNGNNYELLYGVVLNLKEFVISAKVYWSIFI